MCATCGCIPLARSIPYRFLALGFGYPEPSLASRLEEQLDRLERGLRVVEDQRSLELAYALANSLGALREGDLEASYVRSFGHAISKECPPYEAEYEQAHIFQEAQTLADIAGFYRAFGLEVAPDFTDRLDHISVELEFMHFLCLKEAHALRMGHPEERLALCRSAQAKFLDEHLGRWALGFADRLEKKAVGDVHGLLARLLTAFLTTDMEALGLRPHGANTPPSADPPEPVEAEDCEPSPLALSITMGSGPP